MLDSLNRLLASVGVTQVYLNHCCYRQIFVMKGHGTILAFLITMNEASQTKAQVSIKHIISIPHHIIIHMSQLCTAHKSVY